MAHKKGAGSTKNGRDSNSQRLGVKVYGNQPVKAGGIIIRQRGLSVRPGRDIGIGKDYTLFALRSGIVEFTTDKKCKYVNVQKFMIFIFMDSGVAYWLNKLVRLLGL